MDAALQLIDDTGIALRRELLDRGWAHRDITSGLRHGLLHRVRHGAYTTEQRWSATDDNGRHLLACAAAMRVMGDRVALTHTSSLVAQRIAVWGADLSQVHVTRLDGATGRTVAGVVHHEGVVAEGDITETESGLLVSRADRAVVEHASIVTTESGLVSADDALRRGLCDVDTLSARFQAMEHWPGTQRVHLVVRLADGLADSAGESRSRYLFWRQGLPAPVLQFEVYDERGVLIGRTDFAWPEHRLLGEFDGRLKYGRLLRPGESAGDAVFNEKRREDRLREVTGWAMVRLTWDDLRDGVRTAQRIRRLLQQAA